MTRLVLWDIDHTLIATRGVGRELSAAAFEATLGVPMQRQAKIDGITEPVNFRETAKLHGLTTTRTDFERFAHALTEQHHAHAAELSERGHALPGAAAALDRFHRDGVIQSVVTGNVRAVARIKLEVFGLDQHIDWTIGAYGDDHDERAELVRLALQRAAAAATETVLIGDTPADIAAAHAAGTRIVAVASGRFTPDDFRNAGTDTVLPDLQDTALLAKYVRTETG
ncbi:haloacid dehalogenase-like hydrolase [Streptomyces sp. LHD-70]|uniref:HAD family hydrolase n=1 Tax=Streptomyces sp. LHD-70 TaxID=3072140 RepID=UPI0028107E2E|nr:HAD hydrolase-like protein [Streptomyces sp. LHD-70]MDQ8707496.1 haloacid dehalogenase-like hydrolase [Streptomyces sp. LHD-70]